VVTVLVLSRELVRDAEGRQFPRHLSVPSFL
jgi:hypothetical protein